LIQWKNQLKKPESAESKSNGNRGKLVLAVLCTNGSAIASEKAKIEIFGGNLTNGSGSAPILGAAIQGNYFPSSRLSYGAEVFSGSGNISSSIKTDNVVMAGRLNYDLSESFYLGFKAGVDTQGQRSSGSSSISSTSFGLAGLSMGCSLDRKGYSLGAELADYVVSNNPSQNWAGGFLKLIYWTD
jgi:hypothetical protein